MQWRRLAFYLLINIVVSAVTVFLVLSFWDIRQQAALERVTAEADVSFAEPAQEQSTVEPTLVPTIPVIVHQVASGETLGDIAQEYEVTVDELLEINGLADADAIGAGQVIYIPENIEPSIIESTTTVSPVESESPVVGQVEIVSVVGIGDLDTERLIIGEAGGGKHSLAGWQIRDEDENIYSFPQATLYANGQIVLNSKAGIDNPLELFWGTEEPVWESGEMIRLLDANGQEQASFLVP